MNLRDSFRNVLRERILPSSGVKRLHIIGCARSGTTMMHYAMIAYKGVELCDVESGIRYTPSIHKSLSLAKSAWLNRQSICYVTKRNHGWFEEEALNYTIDHIKKENIGVINLTRDPRDVLVSRHRGSQNDDYYVTPERWHLSVAASEYILEQVNSIVPTLNVRYEDVIRDSVKTEEQIAHTFALEKHPNLGPIAQLQANLEKTKLPASDWMTQALHKLRNFDDRSISSWQRDDTKKQYTLDLLNSEELIGRALRDFMSKHRYI